MFSRGLRCIVLCVTEQHQSPSTAGAFVPLAHEAFSGKIVDVIAILTTRWRNAITINRVPTTCYRCWVYDKHERGLQEFTDGIVAGGKNSSSDGARAAGNGFVFHARKIRGAFQLL